MGKLSRRQLIAGGAGIAVLLLLLLFLLLSCGTSGRADQLYPAVVMAEAHSGEAASLITKPEGYPAEVGDALAMMMSLHKEDEFYLYHVAFRDGEAGEASTKDSIVGHLEDAKALYKKEWVEIAADDPRAQGWFYFLFTADEIRTLAGAGIQCRFVGSGESVSAEDTGSLSWEQAVESICQWAGDSFRAKTGA